MKEIEVKVIEINQAEVEKKLVQLGAKKIGEYDIDALNFDTIDKKLSSKFNLLRLRKKGKNYLTFKGKAEQGFAKIVEELEIEVSDFETTKLILEKLGFLAKKTHPKHRVTYKLNNSLIEIDDYFIIPVFLEIESPNEKELKEIIELFGFEEDKIKSWNGFDLFKHYNLELEG
ncbi:MAG: class IV adenylate cyclase [archaeon]|jgi:adenylate cyclase class 2